jgi:hypothetical protein
MFKSFMITALLLSAITAQAELKLVFELNESIMHASEETDSPPHVYLTQNDKSFALQIICKDKPTVMIFDKIPFVAMTIPSPDDLLGEAKIDRNDCEKILNCVVAKAVSKDAFITVSINSETEAFTLDSLGLNCEEPKP